MIIGISVSHYSHSLWPFIIVLISHSLRTACLTISWPNIAQLVMSTPQRILTTAFSLAVINEVNIYRLSQILDNDYGQVMQAYGESCRVRTLEEFTLLIDIAKEMKSDLHRARLLSAHCVNSLEFADTARDHLITHKMPLFMYWDMSSMTLSDWIRFLNSPYAQMYSQWCLSVPESIARELFNDHDLSLPSLVTGDCLCRRYPARDILIEILLKQLESTDPVSMSKFLLLVSGHHQIDHSLNLKIQDAISRGTQQKENSHQRDANLRFLSNNQNLMTDDSFTQALRENTSIHNSVVLLRLWTRVCSLDDIIGRISDMNISLMTANVMDLQELCTELLDAFSLEQRTRFLNTLGLDADELYLRMPPRVWSQTREMESMSFQLRLRYYRRWFMNPSRQRFHSETTISIIPFYYSSIAQLTAMEMRRYFRIETADPEHNWIVNEGSNGYLICRPSTGLRDSGSLETMLSAMIYAVIVLEEPLALMDPEYCNELYAVETYIDAIGHDRIDSNGNSPVSLSKRRILELHSSTFASIQKLWKLDMIFPFLHLCKILSSVEWFE